MTTMTTPVFTMRLDPELKDWLEIEAKRQDRSAAYVAKQAIQSLKDATEAKAQIIREALAEADKGEFISEDSMTAWFESLGTENELPEPEPDVFLNRS
jgi:predicted transcriptional regulator